MLGHILAHPAVDLSNVREALQVYEKVRLPVANAVVERSRTTGLIYEFNYPAAFGCHDEDASLEEMAEHFIDTVYGQWTWQWEGLPSEDWVKAQETLVSVVGSTAKIAGTCPSCADVPAMKGKEFGVIDKIVSHSMPQVVA